ncbi:uncharacterized protein BHQ10_007284 [Talaromyces amestolkiae]|uniref:Centrosomin N-terminal motif 1 domain-containing protein n=1 Tax=Talaromyces amestolkiae TaxID=1196081 RepID=A0A364L648_TALAM|nr:uncharacterized protein BHQ10_007284 [Talaromyces amestolkiae]RAO71272.1 hypothetical protein BHQ10_007284 [Talaromyces amestolkiae]
MDSFSISPQLLSPSSSTRQKSQSTFRSSPRSSPPSVFVRSPPSPPPRPEPLNLQTRRLQLRNARFQGARISPNKVALSDRFATSWRSASPASDASVDKENQSPSPDNTNNNALEQRPHNKSPGSTRRRVSILQEIHDSSQRGRKLRRPSLSRLFGPPLDVSDHHSSLNQRYSYRSPSSLRQLSPYSILRDNDADLVTATYNQQNRSSPLSTFHTNRPRSNSRDRTDSYATERYIEHLEAQLAAVQNQSSPMQASTTKPQVSKLRALNAEIKVLRQEIAEWEDKFDVRVHEEVGLRTDVESKLRTKIIFLEGQLEDYATRIKDLECERDLQAQKLRNVESLRSTNRGLERRIDVLTELLAQSPTRIESRSPEVSPTRSPGPRLSRPKSMLPSVPLRSDVVYPLAEPSLIDPEAGVEKHEPEVPDLIPDDSTIASSVACDSQRSSTISHPSTISSRWSVPLPFSPELQGKTPVRARNMRRFPSGTCTLKPLILPTTTTPTPTSPQRPSLTGEHFSSIYSPGYERGADNATRFAQEETLAALEGRTSHYQAYEDEVSEPEDDNISDSPLSRRSEPNNMHFATTLDSELEEAERNDEFIRPHSRQSSQAYSRLNTPVGSTRLNIYGSHHTPRAYRVPLSVRKGSSADLEAGTSRDSKMSFARRLIVGIWRRSIKQLGRVSWWVLGILFGSEQRNEWAKSSSSLRMRMKPESQHRPSQPVCHACGQCQQTHKREESSTSNSDNLDGINRTILMWTKLSVAMIVAFGRAIRYGPETVLLDTRNDSKNEYRPSSSIRYKSSRNKSIDQTSSFNLRNNDDEHNTLEEHTTWPTRPLTVEDFFIS